MDKLVLFNNIQLKKLLNKRSGESKFGEHVAMLTSITSIYDELKNLDVTHVIIGLPEDVGVFANYGKSGAYNTWNAVIKILINIQNNEFTRANKVLILGYLDFTNEMLKVSNLDQSNKKDIVKARKIVKKIDKQVTYLVHQIVLSGKKPIIIGGGHNNAYGNIKGSSLAFGLPINAVNLDAHTDFRPEEGRHSGNGFSYAYAEGFLKNYFVFGVHENYTSDNLFKSFKKIKTIDFNTFEGLKIRKEVTFKKELQRALNHVSNTPFGIEIDCDAIENIASSAMTPSGFSVNAARTFVDFFGKHENACYLHICEAIATADNEKQIGKLITYLITDFIKANAVKIISYKPKYSANFYDLNIEWLKAYFYVEPYDEEVLSNPLKHIINKGGHIFFAELDKEILGTVALMPTTEASVFELTKMAVSPNHRGKKIGQQLMQHCIDFSKNKNLKSIIIYSSRKLENAIYIYKKYGFVEIPVEDNCPYERCDIKMEYHL
ncbi:GNAT family N-acetyltransferase [Yeosuana sp.]|uniref:GNAT family N-acetyltransferase n=1 Tax=Yeosuana sp. TaxID=2529388 RepID=UPI00405523DB|tara:strand:- start:9938 stop:11410 length:1473 start_codon:yes stop_codon:yes gene_type:complete